MPMRLFNSVRQRVLENVNRILAATPEAAAELSGLNGAVLEFHVSQSEWVIRLTVVDSKLCFVEREDTRTPNVRIEGGVADYLAMFSAQAAGDPLAAGRIDIQGDLATAQRLQNVMRLATIDWEDLLAQHTGEVFAYQLARSVRGGLNVASKTRATIEASLSDYLRFELEMLPTREQVTDFVQATTRLDSDVDRLAARLRILERRS